MKNKQKSLDRNNSKSIP